MLIQNVFVENAAQATDIRITDGKFERLEPGLTPLPGEEVIDGSGCLALPPFIESHVHLDTCLTAGRSSPARMCGSGFTGRYGCRPRTACSSCVPTWT